MKIDVLEVPGARLHYEVRGAGPTLLFIAGSNGDAGLYESVAADLADRFTVVTYDRRGFSRSTLTQPYAGEWSHVHTEDACRLLDAITDRPSYVFGSSAGAVIGLALLSRHPDHVRALIAHEPPLAEILPDAMRWRTFFEDVYDAYRRHGAEPAMRMFMTGIGLDTLARPVGVTAAMMERLAGNLDFFLEHELRYAPTFAPDLAALDARAASLVVAGGRDSRGQFAYRGAAALADRWGRSLVDFPGDHTAYWSDPVTFSGSVADAFAAVEVVS